LYGSYACAEDGDSIVRSVSRQIDCNVNLVGAKAGHEYLVGQLADILKAIARGRNPLLST
jgi:hypothetical protein